MAPEPGRGADSGEGARRHDGERAPRGSSIFAEASIPEVLASGLAQTRSTPASELLRFVERVRRFDHVFGLDGLEVGLSL